MKGYSLHASWLLCLPLLVACAAPIAILPASSIMTSRPYLESYENYDRRYRVARRFMEHRVPRDDYSPYAREFGHANEGPAILLLHGFPDSLHLYDLIAPALGESRRVIAFDFLGWGRSDKPEDHEYDMASLRRDLEAVIAYFRLDQLVLVTHDASGPPVIDWALENETRIASLVLLNTFYNPMKTLEAPEAIALFSAPSVRRSVTRFGAHVSDFGWMRGFTNQVSNSSSTSSGARSSCRYSCIRPSVSAPLSSG